MEMRRAAVLLHNVRSAHNVGSILRTAECAGVERVYLTGYTPLPVDRFGRVQKEIQKTALGAERLVRWEHVSSPAAVIAKVRRDGWRIVGVEQDPRALDYRRSALALKTCFVFGNEVRGISPQLRNQCDVLIEIPMCGKKESLNVSVAAGIILFSFVQ